MEFNPLIPELTVTDFSRSLTFYIQVLGFKIEYQREESGFAMISREGAQLMLEQKNGHWEVAPLEPPFGRGINFEIGVSSLDPILSALQKTGTPLFKAPVENWYRKDDHQVGQREFLVQDPDGYLLRFAQSLGSRPI